jgi:hypothetical protein
MEEGRRPTSTPARLDKEGPATTYLSVTVLPRAVTGSPVEPEKSRAARAGLLHARKTIPAYFPQRTFKKGRP